MSVQATIALLNKNANASSSVPPPVRHSSNRSTEKRANISRTNRTNKTTNGGIASILSKFDQKSTTTPDDNERMPLRKSITHSEPSLKRMATKTIKDSRNSAKSLARLNALTDELVAMYQDLLNKCADKASSTTPNSASPAQIEEYEARIRTLTKELEESTHARKELEKKLECCTHQKSNTAITAADGDSSIVVSNNAKEWPDPKTNNNTDDEQLLFSKRHLADVEKGAQMMLARQARDLETERLQTRALKQVIFKQDKLVTALEAKLSQQRKQASDKSALLKEQIELQRIELEDKQALLAKLLDEKEELLLRLTMMNKDLPISYSTSTTSNNMKLGRHRSASVRSSIDVLAEMIESDIRFADVTTKQPISRISTSSLGSSSFGAPDTRPTSPPSSGPPRDPLPPLPSMPSLSSIRTSGSMTTISSPTTSWSSVDCSTAALYAQLKTSDVFNSNTLYRDSSLYRTDSPTWPGLTIETIMDSATMPAASVPEDTTEICGKLPKKSSNPAFWKGWKQRFGSR